MNHRYEELDSLRGLAALSVFFGHIYLIFNESFISKLLFEYGPLRISIAGSEAVTLFFVLSGFVLSLPFFKDGSFNYSAYVVKRICRIYLPYLAAIIIALLSRDLFYTGKINGLTTWFNGSWLSDLSFKSLMDHILLIRTFSSNLNSVVWSLVHEMRISLIFPFVVLLLNRLNLIQGIGIAVALSGVSVIYSTATQSPFQGTEWYSTVHYLAVFMVGALIAKHRQYLISKVSTIGSRRRVILSLVGIALYLYLHPSFILNLLFQGMHPFYRSVIDTWFTSIGAGIIILVSLTSSLLSKFLLQKSIHYLGKISYSLYLCHITVLLSCVHLFNQIIPMWAICLISVVGTLVLSSLMYHFIEQPSIKLGRLITSMPAFKRRTTIIENSGANVKLN